MAADRRRHVDRAQRAAAPTAPAPAGPADVGRGARGTAADHVVGVGLRPGATPAEVDDLVRRTLDEAGVAPEAVRAVATVAGRTGHPAVTALPWPAVGFPADALAGVAVPTPEARVAAAVGTPGVAEAAALAAAGPGARIVVPKRRSAAATVAVARAVGRSPTTAPPSPPPPTPPPRPPATEDHP